MLDPIEGVSPEGSIVTGADRARIPTRFQTILDEAVASLAERNASTDVYVYGSVATGTAIPGVSDVDLLTIGASSADADDVAATMSQRYATECRAVDVAVAQASNYIGDADEAYGNRVFLRHYCVYLAGPRAVDVSEDFPADRRAARGFNGDIGHHLSRWRNAIGNGAAANVVGRTLARKTLLAVAGLVSVHDRTWTTDRNTAARRWAHLHPELDADLATLQSWSDGTQAARHQRVTAMLRDTVPTIVTSFETDIGLWP